MATYTQNQSASGQLIRSQMNLATGTYCHRWRPHPTKVRQHTPYSRLVNACSCAASLPSLGDALLTGVVVEQGVDVLVRHLRGNRYGPANAIACLASIARLHPSAIIELKSHSICASFKRSMKRKAFRPFRTADFRGKVSRDFHPKGDQWQASI
jgi:hypothetical protein